MRNVIIAIWLLVAVALSASASGAELLVPTQYPTIQSAIDAAVDGDTVIVVPGTYTGPGNRDISFLGKAITVRSADPDDPNIVSATIIDCNISNTTSFHFTSGEDANSVLAGFTFTNTNTNPRMRFVSAIYCSGSSPVINNCVISNSGPIRGIECRDNSNPIINNCIISGNSNCGILCYGSSPVITNCTITGNSTNYGGGIYCNGSNLMITNCIISGNTARTGGAIYAVSSSPKVVNCTITGNSAKNYGGGIYSSSSMSIANSIIWGNADSTGQGQSAQVYGAAGVWFSCIQDDNSEDANIPFDGEIKFNIDDDPCFVQPGHWDATGLWHDGDYHLLPASPCIEAGNPYFTYHAGDIDMDAQPRLMGRYVDIGADEFEIAVIVVTKPQGGEVWTGGSTHEIKWDSYTVTGNVDIYYSINNGDDWIKIGNVPNTGSFIWNLPDTQSFGFHHKRPVDSNQCLVLVEPNSPVPSLICKESGLFTIQPYRSLPAAPHQPKRPHPKFGPEHGCVKWKFQTDGPVTAGVTIGYNNRVHVPCEDGKLYTLNANGTLLWTYDTNSPLVGSPAVDRNGTVYAGAENGKLYAIDRFGRLLWTHTTKSPIYSSPVVSPDCLAEHRCHHLRHCHTNCWSLEQPAQVYVCSVDGALYALGQDGSELWSFETDGIGVATGSIFASPVIGPDGSVYIAGLYDPNLYALDSNNGSVVRNRTFSVPYIGAEKPWPFASPVIAHDGTIYTSFLFNSNLYAVDSNDGSIIWSTNLADPCSGWFEPGYAQPYRHPYCWSKPALAPDGTIYLSFDDPYLRAINPDGNIKWVTRLGAIGGFTFTVGGDGLIYAASDDAYLYVVDPDGRQIAQFEGAGGLSFPTITVGRTIIVSDANNTVWAIGQDDNCSEQVLTQHWLEDLNGDGTVDYTDLALLADDWLNCTDAGLPCNYQGNQIYLKGDVDKDQYVDFADFAQIANRWLNKE
ncbi:MAG: PQQ-binding-like beta-propeller repeat protein [Sedimentisphaerales bacterium]